MNKLICGYCGTIEETEKPVSEHIFFPNRWAYIKPNNYPVKCKNCGCDNDMVIFGKQFVSDIFPAKETANFGNIDLNNMEYEKNKKTVKEFLE